jgi:hypothetical protein
VWNQQPGFVNLKDSPSDAGKCLDCPCVRVEEPYDFHEDHRRSGREKLMAKTPEESER